MKIPVSLRFLADVIRPLLFVLMCAGIETHGAAPADAQIKGALDDIQKFENQFAAGGTVNAAAASRTLKLLALTRQRLDSSPNHLHESWIEADTRLKSLVARLQSTTNPAPSASPAPAASPGSAGTPAPSQMISQYRVRLQKLIRDIASAADTLDRNGVKPFQSADYVAEQLAIAARFKEALAGYSDFAGDTEVVAAGNALARFDNMIVFGRNHAAGEAAALGDVQASLRALNEQMGRVPEPPSAPYDGERVREWLAAVAAVRDAAAAALQSLALIRERAYLPIQPGTVEQGAPYDKQDVDRIEWGYRDNAAKAEQAVAQFAANLDAQVAHVAETLAHIDGLDPADASDQTNSFLGAGAAARVREQLATAQQLAQVAVEVDRQLGREQLAAHAQVLARVEKSRSDYEARLARARELVRVPKAVSTDRSLLAIAHETLKNPSYGAGPLRRVVINVDKVHREKKTSETQFDKVDVSAGGNVTLSGTETTYFYAWDQFQVATVEPVGDAFYIYFNTLKNFSSGGPTTPLNRWIVAERFQGSEIPAANIDRD